MNTLHDAKRHAFKSIQPIRTEITCNIIQNCCQNLHKKGSCWRIQWGKTVALPQWDPQHLTSARDELTGLIANIIIWKLCHRRNDRSQSLCHEEEGCFKLIIFTCSFPTKGLLRISELKAHLFPLSDYHINLRKQDAAD